MLKKVSYEVIDLGKEVLPEIFVEIAERKGKSHWNLCTSDHNDASKKM